MTARELLAELEAAGITVTCEGQDLRVRANPGVTLTPYLDRIRKMKPELLALLEQSLQARIVAAATVDPGQFDRALFDSLMADWDRSELLAKRLADGWEQIEQAKAEGMDVARWESFWLNLLVEYKRACQGLPMEATPADQP